VEINEDINRLPSTLLRLRAAVLVRLLCSLATCWRLQYHADLPLQASQCISFISPGPEQKCFFQFPSLRTSFIMLEIGGGGIDCETVEISLLCTRLHLNQGAISYEPFSKQSIGTTQFSRGFQLSLRPLVELMNNAVGRGWRLCLAETLSRQLAQLPDDLLACYGFSNQKMESTQLPINSTAYPRSLYRISLPPAPSVAGQLLDGVVLEIAQRTNCSDLFSVEVFAVICYADRNEPYTILRSPDVEDCVLGLLERVFIISTCRALVMKCTLIITY
jgi:hypothetical protein